MRVGGCAYMKIYRRVQRTKFEINYTNKILFCSQKSQPIW